MKSQDEIVEKIKSEKDDFFGAKRGDWIDFLDFEHAKEFLKPEVTAEEWKPKENTPEGIKACIINYLPFAWDKANGCRGISANRSINHMEAYLWLLGDEEFTEKFNHIEYQYYGKDALIAVSEYVGFDWRAVDDGIRTNG
jgi:hypothetical protein